MTFSTERHVHIFTSYQLLGVITSCSKGEACIVFTEFADSSQLLDLLTLWEESQDIREGTSQESTLQR